MPRSGELPRIGLRLLQSTPVIADTLGGGEGRFSVRNSESP